MARFALTAAQSQALADLAARWGVREFGLFGSALGEAFTDASDVDLLVDFRPGVRRSLFDLVTMEDELSRALGRPVDLVSRRGVERSANPIRRRAILRSARPLYTAAP